MAVYLLSEAVQTLVEAVQTKNEAVQTLVERLQTLVERLQTLVERLQTLDNGVHFLSEQVYFLVERRFSLSERDYLKICPADLWMSRIIFFLKAFVQCFSGFGGRLKAFENWLNKKNLCFFWKSFRIVIFLTSLEANFRQMRYFVKPIRSPIFLCKAFLESRAAGFFECIPANQARFPDASGLKRLGRLRKKFAHNISSAGN